MIPNRIARSLSGSFSLCDLQIHSIVEVGFCVEDAPPRVDASREEIDLQATTGQSQHDICHYSVHRPWHGPQDTGRQSRQTGAREHGVHFTELLHIYPSLHLLFSTRTTRKNLEALFGKYRLLISIPTAWLSFCNAHMLALESKLGF
jgi:hypothetical protein